MKLATRFWLMTAVSFAAYLTIGLGMYMGVQKMAQLSYQQAISDEMNVLRTARNVAQDEYLNGNARARLQWIAAQNKLKKIVAASYDDFPDPAQQKILTVMTVNLETTEKLFELLPQRFLKRPAEANTQEWVIIRRLVQLSRSFVLQWDRLGRLNSREAVRFHRLLSIAIALSVALFIAMTVLGSSIVRKQVIQPVMEIKSGARRLAEGSSFDDIPAKRSDELGELAHAFNEMKRRILATHEEQEKKIAERTSALESSNKELRQFAYIASHDLQEPLRVMTNYLQLLEKTANDRLSETDRRYIDVASRQAFRMRNLIRGVLDFSSIESRGRTRAPVDLAAALRNAVANLQQAINESGARVHWGDMPTITGDSILITQLFQNLIGNAIKYKGDQPPSIDIRATQEKGGGWVLAVADNGIGIAPEYREKIFGMFQRLHTGPAFTGTGIGLAVCKKIAETHGGTIWVESEVGHGSVFFVRFPREENSLTKA